MARITSKSKNHRLAIDRKSVLAFFESRSEKAMTLGPIRAVIYQDKNVDLAVRKDAAEKYLLHPKIKATREDRVLDVGCGTGRWADVIVPECAFYHGVDSSPGMIRVANERLAHASNVRFSVCSLEELSLEIIDTYLPFSCILLLGVMVYINDEDILAGLTRIANVAAPAARILFREPVALRTRLTLIDHFSEEMGQSYSAIYRTESEILGMIGSSLGPFGFWPVDQGDVFIDPAINNRVETKQRYFLWKRERV